MSVTIKQLAEKLGLDHSTVAYALSGKGTIKEATRELVRKTANEMGYVPNRLARGLRATRTHVIGDVFPDVVAAYSELVQQIFRQAGASGYEAQVALTEFDGRLEERAVRSLLESRVDGIIIKTCHQRWDEIPPHGALKRMAARKIPIVVYGYELDGSSLPWLAFPCHRQSELATRHLMELGHTDLAWLIPRGSPMMRAQTFRIEGSIAALRSGGISPDRLRIVTLDSPTSEDDLLAGDDVVWGYINETLPRFGVRRGRALMRRAMKLSPQPTAVLCQNETSAIGAILEAHAMGLDVPRDVAVIAAGRGPTADLSPVSLTTVDVLPEQAAAKAIEMLFTLMKTPGASLGMQTVEPILTVGQSTVAAT